MKRSPKMPSFVQLRARIVFDDVTWFVMMFAYVVAAVCSIAALLGVTWLMSFALTCATLGAVIEAREWHRLATIFAFLSFAKERELALYRERDSQRDN